MSKDENKKKLVGPWRNIHTAVWLIGLAVLAYKGWWWPGILVLVGISLIVEAVLMKVVPHAFVEENSPVPAPVVTDSPIAEPRQPEHRLDLLPSNCPKCGGPIRGHDVKWTGIQSADCPFCGMNLPMAKS
jgi:hypothetical protein